MSSMSKSQQLVAGVDSSTQSVKIVVRDAESGELRRQAKAPHPDGTEVDPLQWWSALSSIAPDLLEGVSAISIAAQQHGMVPLDSVMQLFGQQTSNDTALRQPVS